MADRTVTDTSGRTWKCVPTPMANAEMSGMGRDVILSCTTPSVPEAVKVTVGWQWEKMSDNGLGRMVSLASPVPRD